MIDVERSLPAPGSLADGRRYDGDDVRDRLFDDFFGKCYLCEGVVSRGSFQIDHRRGQTDFPEQRCAWDNLFPTHGPCNGARKRSWPEGGLLDPAGGDEVESRVVQWLDPELLPRFRAASEDDVAADNTARELEQIHDAPGARMRCADLRAAIHRQAIFVLKAFADLREAQPSERAARREGLRRLLSRSAPYSMLVRSVVAQYEAARQLFD